MTVNELIGLLAQKAIWNYEIRFVGFSDKYSAKVVSIVPKLTEDGRPLLEIFGEDKGIKWTKIKNLKEND